MENKLWEQQPYDTLKSFEIFLNFYLYQKERPRSLLKAYIDYSASRGRDVSNETEPSVLFVKWSKGVGARAYKGVGATWEERAKAYDDYLTSRSMGANTFKRASLRKDEYSDYQEMLTLWDDLFNVTRAEIRNQIEEKKASPASLLSQMEKVLRIRDEISSFGRRSLQMPSKINDIPKDEEQEKMEIVWVDSLDDDDEVGLGVEELASTGKEILNVRDIERNRRYAETEETRVQRKQYSQTS